MGQTRDSKRKMKILPALQRARDATAQRGGKALDIAGATVVPHSEG